jgi:HK97 gp10 family phage protein
LAFTSRTSGFRELDQALTQIAQRSQRPLLLRALRKAAAPLAAEIKQRAPRDEGDLQASIIVSTRLTKRQRRMNRSSKSFAEIHVGPSGDGTAGVLNYAWHVEFGTAEAAAQPFMRPAWDGFQGRAIDLIRSELAAAISRSMSAGAVARGG